MPSPPHSLERIRTMVRMYMHDTPFENRLIAGVESSRDHIDLAIFLTIDDFNQATIPLIGNYTLTSFPSIKLLVIGAVLELLKMAGICQSRNHLSFTSGGISAVISDKTAAYQSWINVLSREYEAKKAEIKSFLNVRNAWGGIQTPYAGLSYYNGGYAPQLSEVFLGFQGFF